MFTGQSYNTGGQPYRDASLKLAFSGQSYKTGGQPYSDTSPMVSVLWVDQCPPMSEQRLK